MKPEEKRVPISTICNNYDKSIQYVQEYYVHYNAKGARDALATTGRGQLRSNWDRLEARSIRPRFIGQPPIETDKIFLVIQIIERTTCQHMNFHRKEFLTGVSESADSFPGYRSDVKINAITVSKIISNMRDNQKMNKIPLKDEFSPRIIIRTSKRMH